MSKGAVSVLASGTGRRAEPRLAFPLIRQQPPSWATLGLGWRVDELYGAALRAGGGGFSGFPRPMRCFSTASEKSGPRTRWGPSPFGICTRTSNSRTIPAFQGPPGMRGTQEPCNGPSISGVVRGLPLGATRIHPRGTRPVRVRYGHGWAGSPQRPPAEPDCLRRRHRRGRHDQAHRDNHRPAGGSRSRRVVGVALTSRQGDLCRCIARDPI